MSRTKLFVSYSHRDYDWLERLRIHLALLERRELIHVWVDTQIAFGANWQEEIERALDEATVALLLVSPDFLASSYIWDEDKEMDRIMAHAELGMDVLSLIIRPCAWQLEENLARFQARPAEGRALSTVSEAQVDLDLAALVYELAARVWKLPASLASQEWGRAEQYQASPSPAAANNGGSYQGPNVSGTETGAGTTTTFQGTALSELPQSWTGPYSNYITLRLTIRDQQGRDFQGSIRYLNTDTVTSVEGRFEEDFQEIVADLRPIIDGTDVPEAQLALRFKETGYEIEGTQRISFAGEYRALVLGNSIVGAWFGDDGHLAAGFNLTRDNLLNGG
jgi:hypothetical protein